MDYNLLFSVDDLFVAVRDPQLRAFNRLTLYETLKLTMPRVALYYFKIIKQTDPKAVRELVQIKRRLQIEGKHAVQMQLKYCINPYDQNEVETCTKRSQPLYRPFS